MNFSELTGEAGSARRAELARHVATLFALTSDRCSDEQVDIYDSVLLRLVDMVEAEVRRYVADQMASLRRGPEETIRRLADDDIEVAEPILLRSTVLRDADLIRIAEKARQRAPGRDRTARGAVRRSDGYPRPPGRPQGEAEGCQQ
ncbi:hypothetical protein QW131_13230 [Roseibium salinum]|nr:hypothetical protein [Roseibium salinum]